jgi:PIN domain nuclease of toxin-antitoxin system
MAAWGVDRLPLEPEHSYRTTELPAVHRDPFDRLLVAQALAHGLSIVTPDAAIRGYPVAVVW